MGLSWKLLYTMVNSVILSPVMHQTKQSWRQPDPAQVWSFLLDFQMHPSWTWFSWLSAWWLAALLSLWCCCWFGWPIVTEESGCCIQQLHLKLAVAVFAGEETWSYRDQEGSAANYADQVLTSIAADNYISQQTVEQSILLVIGQEWPVLSAGIGQNRQWEEIQLTPLLIGDTAAGDEFHT